MKRTGIVVCVILCLFLAAILAASFNANVRLLFSMNGYAQAVSGELPEDLRLTIYYVSPDILTRAPLSVEQLISASDEVIEVTREELADHEVLLRTLNASALRPVKEETYLDARLYYVFETDSGKLLEVAMNGWDGNAFVNGVEVEPDSVLLEIIEPFMPDDGKEMWGM